MKQQLNLFFLALGFFSRIPIPAWVAYSPEQLNQCSRYFALVGWLLGGIVAAVLHFSNMLFSQELSVFIAMLASLLLTGVFHEDGLADTADGFGGGLEKSHKLEIMKDSRLGTYGVAALTMALLGKWLLLSESVQPLIAVLIAYPVSRAIAASLIFDMQYVTETNSKSKPLAMHQSFAELLILSGTAALALLLLDALTASALLCTLIVLRIGVKRWLLSQIGGYTGDNLGAVQQITELFIYFSLHCFWSFL